jgi:hypothetical protein
MAIGGIKEEIAINGNQWQLLSPWYSASIAVVENENITSGVMR